MSKACWYPASHVTSSDDLTNAAASTVTGPTNDMAQALPRPVFAERLLPRPGPGPATEAWRIFVKAFHSLAVVAMGSAAIYLMYCAISGRRDVFTVLALVMIGVEAVIYATFGRKCPLTILARNLGDEGGHDYLFEWILGTKRIKYVARSLALLSVIGVVMLIVATLVG